MFHSVFPTDWLVPLYHFDHLCHLLSEGLWGCNLCVLVFFMSMIHSRKMLVQGTECSLSIHWPMCRISFYACLIIELLDGMDQLYTHVIFVHCCSQCFMLLSAKDSFGVYENVIEGLLVLYFLHRTQRFNSGSVFSFMS